MLISLYLFSIRDFLEPGQHAPVAQLGEHNFDVVGVNGSIPFWCTKYAWLVQQENTSFTHFRRRRDSVTGYHESKKLSSEAAGVMPVKNSARTTQGSTPSRLFLNAPLAQLAEAISSNLIQSGSESQEEYHLFKKEKNMISMNTKKFRNRKTKRFGSFNHGLIKS